MRIAITGGSGFIGTEVIAAAGSREETHIIALTRSVQPGGSQADFERVVWRHTDYSVNSLAAALSGADCVIHLAGARGTSIDPDEFRVNEEITENLLKAMKIAGVKRIVFASTISVYDDESLIPWKESSPLEGRTAYGDSKIRCEALIREYAESIPDTGLGYAIIRIAQVLGHGERRRGMMNVFLDTARSGGELKVMGVSKARRQYIYVRDLADILLVASERTDNLIINAGMPHAYSNLEIARIVNRVCINTTPINYDDSFPETIRSSYMDTSLLVSTLRVHPLDMEDAVRHMINV